MIGKGWGRFFLLLAWVIGLALLYVPILTLIAYSFFSTEDQAFGDTLNLLAYRALLADENLLNALLKSVQIAIVSSTVALLLGGFAALTVGRRSHRYKNGTAGYSRKIASLGINALTMLPMLLPEIVFGLGLLVWFVLLRISLGSVSLILAHVTFSVSYVYLTVSARMRLFDPAIEDAALDLGANGWQTFAKIYLPVLAPSLVAGWVMAFALSFDDFLISFFTAGPDTVTLPLALYSSIKFGVSPSVFAMASLVFMVSFVSATVMAQLSRRAISNTRE